jgi:hypothetical protein
MHATILCQFPDVKILSHYKVKKLLIELTGVTSVEQDMCINLYIGYTGLFAIAEFCMHCDEPQYEPERVGKISYKQFLTLLLTPQL